MVGVTTLESRWRVGDPTWRGGQSQGARGHLSQPRSINTFHHSLALASIPSVSFRPAQQFSIDAA